MLFFKFILEWHIGDCSLLTYLCYLASFLVTFTSGDHYSVSKLSKNFQQQMGIITRNAILKVPAYCLKISLATFHCPILTLHTRRGFSVTSKTWRLEILIPRLKDHSASSTSHILFIKKFFAKPLQVQKLRFPKYLVLSGLNLHRQNFPFSLQFCWMVLILAQS